MAADPSGPVAGRPGWRYLRVNRFTVPQRGALAPLRYSRVTAVDGKPGMPSQVVVTVLGTPTPDEIEQAVIAAIDEQYPPRGSGA